MPEPRTAALAEGENPEAAKGRLELTKLELEIQALRQPLLTKLQFYMALGPTVLAIGTLGVGFYSGLFDVKSESINNRNALLKIEEHNLRTEIGVLRAEVESEKATIRQELEDERARLEKRRLAYQAEAEAKIADQDEQFQVELAELQEDFNAGKEALEGLLGPLQQELAQVKEEIRLKSDELEVLRKRSEEVHLTTLLDQMARDESLDPFNQSSRELINQIKEDPSQIEIVKEYISKSDNGLLILNCFYVLYKATSDKVWFDKVIEFTKDPQNSSIGNMWTLIGAGDWSVADEIEIMKFIQAQAAGLNLDSYRLGQAFQVFQMPASDRPTLGAFSESEQADLFVMGRGLALDEDAFWTLRSYGLLACEYFFPESFPVLLGEVMSDGDAETRGQVQVFLAEIRSGFWDQLQELSGILTTAGLESTSAEKWKENAFVQGWKPLVLESDREELIAHFQSAAESSVPEMSGRELGRAR